MLICSNCGHTADDRHRFCILCGSNQLIKNDPGKKQCKKCGLEMKKEALFCIYCGTSANFLDQKDAEDNNRCGACGLLNREHSLFCTSCGSKIRQSLPEKTDPPSKERMSSTFSNQQNIPGSSGLNVGMPQTSQRAAISQKKKKEHPWGWLYATIASVTVVAVLAYSFLPFATRRVFPVHSLEEAQMWELDGDFNRLLAGRPAKIELSGSRPVKISTRDGLTLFAPKNALDADREISLRRLQEDEVEKIYTDNSYGVPVAVYDYDAGLDAGEYFPGDVSLTFDLSKYDIPEEAYEQVMVLRRSKNDDEIDLLRGSLNGSKYTCYTNKNSFLEVVVITTIAASVLFGYLAYYERDSKFTNAFGKDAKWLSSIFQPGGPGSTVYNIYWPASLGVGDADEVRKALLKEIDFFKDINLLEKGYDADPYIQKVMGGEIPWRPQDLIYQNPSPEYHKEFLPLFADGPYIDQFRPSKSIEGHIIRQMHSRKSLDGKEYLDIRDTENYAWIAKNWSPRAVSIALIQIDEADNYLFETRKLKRPSSVEVFITDREIGSWGFAYNPSTGRPYMTISYAQLMKDGRFVKDIDNPVNKDIIENILATMTHELFHVVQASRYIYTIDWNKNAWFWEATAILLESEAVEAFKKETKYGALTKISKDFENQKFTYYEAYGRPPGIFSYWGSLEKNRDALIHQGYMTGYLLIFLRNCFYSPGGFSAHYGKDMHPDDLRSIERGTFPSVRGQQPDQFLINLLESYRGSYRTPLRSCIIAQTTNSEKDFLKILEAYYELVAQGISSRTVDARTAGSGSQPEFLIPWVVMDKVELSENNAAVEIRPYKTPFSSIVRVIDLKINHLQYGKDGVKFVVQKMDEDMQKQDTFNLRVGKYTTEGKFEYQKMMLPITQAFEDFNERSVYIQEMHLYRDGWFNNFKYPYLVYIMLKPDPPRMEEKKDDNGNTIGLSIDLGKKSDLFRKLTDMQYRITFTDPLGNIEFFFTDLDRFEIPVSIDDGMIDWDHPELEKILKEGFDAQLGSIRSGKDAFSQDVDVSGSTVDIGGSLSSIGSTGEVSFADFMDILRSINLGALFRTNRVLNAQGTKEDLKNNYSVSICEVREFSDTIIFGPESDETKMEIEFSSGKITGVWSGPIYFSDEIMTLSIQRAEADKYLVTTNGFDMPPFHIVEIRPDVFKVVSPTADFESPDFDFDALASSIFFELLSPLFGGANMVLIGNEELQMLAPPATLKRQ